MNVFIFGKIGCARCESTKKKVSHLLDKWGVSNRVGMSFVDMGTVEGLAEGSFHDVFQVPATIVKHGGQEVDRWDGIVPESDALRVSLDVQSIAAGDQGAVGEQSY